MKFVVRRDPGDFFPPGKLDDVVQVRNGSNFVVVRLLAQAVERITGVEFGAAREMFEVFDGHEFALGHAMNVHVSANAVFHALFDEFLFECPELCVRARTVAGNHTDWQTVDARNLAGGGQ